MTSSDGVPLLSEKPIPRRERLIVALDVPDLDEARKLVEQLDESVTFYKVGLEFMMSGSYFALADELAERGKKLFFDLKLFDIPETVAGAVRQLARRGATFLSVHGNQAMLEAACREKGETKILGVSVLTSFDRDDLHDLGFPDPVDVTDVVLSRARRALAAGCDGVVSSGLEARRIREELGQHLLVVTPGIRPVANEAVQDQKRVMTPREAFLAGADYVVVGRPVRAAQDPRAAAESIQQTIAELF